MWLASNIIKDETFVRFKRIPFSVTTVFAFFLSFALKHSVSLSLFFLLNPFLFDDIIQMVILRVGHCCQLENYKSYSLRNLRKAFVFAHASSAEKKTNRVLR